MFVFNLSPFFCLHRYDIVGLDDRASESCIGIESSVERIRSLLQQERTLGNTIVYLLKNEVSGLKSSVVQRLIVYGNY